MRILPYLLSLLLIIPLLGCSSDPEPEITEKPEELKPLLEPFDPPTFDELNAKVKWVDQRVIDSVDLLREFQADKPALISVEEALNLRNDSAAANEKILSALGKLPENDDQVNWNASIARRTAGDVKSTNPLLASSTAEFDINGMTSFGLFSFDWRMEPFASADTVKSWQTSEDGLYNKVVLRDDLNWSDGHPITAHDVVFSFFTIMDPRVPVPAMRSGTDQLRWVHAYDDHTVVYFHKEPRPTNVWDVNFAVIPKHIYEKTVKEDPTLATSKEHVRLDAKPVVGGAYIITKRERGQEIVLKRREEYYMHNGKQVRDKPFFEEVRFQIVEDPNTALLALKKGELEELELTAEQWQTQSGSDDFYRRNTRATGQEWVSFHFCWNCETVFFKDARVRQAMSYAFDHEEMLDKILYGLYEPAAGPFHESSWMAPESFPEPYKQNLKKAEELLAEAGWEDTDFDNVLDKEVGGRRVPFEFSIITKQGDPVRMAICTLLKESLSRVGVVCNVKPMEFTVLQQVTQDHKFQATMGGWGTGTDPSTLINIFGTGEDRNFGNYSSKRIDELFVEGRRELNQEKRAEIYAELHNILYEEQPYTWLYYRNSFYGFNKSLRGYKFSPRGPFNYSPGFSSLWKPAAQ